MELSELCLDDKLLVYLDLPTQSEVICRKIRINPDNDNFSHSHFKICIDELLFIKEGIEIDNLTLSSIKGIISPFNKHLLVTISFDNNFYEVICNAVYSKKFDNSFKFLGIQYENELLPTCYSHVILKKIESSNIYIKTKLQRFGEAIEQNEPDKENLKKECSDFIIKEITSIASSGVYRNSGPGFNSNYQDSKECYYGCHIHSIEVLKDFELKPNLINNLLTERKFYRSEPSARDKWHDEEMKITYLFEEKTVLLTSTYQETSRHFSWGEGYQEDTDFFDIVMKKQFATRYKMETYIEYLEKLLVSEGSTFNNERNGISNYSKALKIFKSDFEYQESYT